MGIPCILHYVWVGPRPLPERDRGFIDDWRRLMPGWRVMAWTEAEIDWSVRYVQHAYATCGWNRVANYLRMQALHAHGGFYLDTDVELLRPLDPLRGHAAVLGFQERQVGPSCVNNAVIGAVPQHPFIAAALETYRCRMPGWRRMGDAHGPGVVTRLLMERGLRHYSDEPQLLGEVTLMPVDRFYPYHWTEPFTPECVTPHTFAVHHWEASWKAPHRLTPRIALRALAALAAPHLAAWATHRRVTAARNLPAGPVRPIGGGAHG
jgi:mannosyltransferase OCH1-like enzyme